MGERDRIGTGGREARRGTYFWPITSASIPVRSFQEGLAACPPYFRHAGTAVVDFYPPAIEALITDVESLQCPGEMDGACRFGSPSAANILIHHAPPMSTMTVLVRQIAYSTGIQGTSLLQLMLVPVPARNRAEGWEGLPVLAILT
jgi:hypothetical protein